MELLGYGAAFLMGITLGLMGGGGSILTVPILVYLFHLNPMEATGYSLFIVGLTALFGGLSYFRKGEADLKTGLTFVIPSLVGVYLTRSVILPNLPDPVLTVGSLSIAKPLLIMGVFAVLMLAASRSMILGKKIVVEKSNSPAKKRVFLILTRGFFVGCVTGFVGAGGGFLIIPTLVVLIGIPMRTAVGTSLFIIATNSLIGFAGDLQHQTSVNWGFLLTIVAIAFTGLFTGVSFSRRVPEVLLKKAFGYFVLIMGAFILFDQIRHL